MYRGDVPIERSKLPRIEFPALALTRIQWSGRWCEPGVPIGARYRKTHWIAEFDEQVYDVNASTYGLGWISRERWETGLVPWLLNAAVPRADGKFWPTHIWRIG